MTPVTQILRERTRMRHTALEQTPLACDLMSLQLTVPRYVEILSTWVGAWAALEDCIQGSPYAPQVAALLPSRRAHLGREDLQFWHAQGYATACAGAPVEAAFGPLRPTTTAGLLGVCYVARGASLGGQIIARHLIQTLPPGSERGTNFFAPGEAPPLTWPQWSHALGEQLDTPEALAQAVVWADTTFATLQDAFEGVTA